MAATATGSPKISAQRREGLVRARHDQRAALVARRDRARRTGPRPRGRTGCVGSAAGRRCGLAAGRFPRRRPPNRTCAFPRIRLSTSTAEWDRFMRAPVASRPRNVRDRRGLVRRKREPFGSTRGLVPRGRDLRTPVAVALDAHRRPGCRASIPRSRMAILAEVAPPDLSSTSSCGCFLRSQPIDPPPGVAAQVGERPLGRGVAEVGLPSPAGPG